MCNPIGINHNQIYLQIYIIQSTSIQTSTSLLFHSCHLHLEWFWQKYYTKWAKLLPYLFWITIAAESVGQGDRLVWDWVPYRIQSWECCTLSWYLGILISKSAFATPSSHLLNCYWFTLCTEPFPLIVLITSHYGNHDEQFWCNYLESCDPQGHPLTAPDCLLHFRLLPPAQFWLYLALCLICFKLCWFMLTIIHNVHWSKHTYKLSTHHCNNQPEPSTTNSGCYPPKYKLIGLKPSVGMQHHITGKH